MKKSLSISKRGWKILFLFFAIYSANTLYPLSWKLFDFATKLTLDSAKQSSKIVLVTVTEDTVKRYWENAFWTRDRYRSLIEKLEKEKPEKIIFDYYLNSYSKPDNIDWELLKDVSWLDNAQMNYLFSGYSKELKNTNYISSQDIEFSNTLSKYKNIIIPELLNENDYTKMMIPVVDLFSKSWIIWASNRIQDNDWIIRKMPYFFWKSKSIAELASEKIIKPGSYIRYFWNPYETFIQIPFEYAYNRRYVDTDWEPVDLKWKIVIIWDYSPLFWDLHKTSISNEPMSWMELLANEIETLHQNKQVKTIISERLSIILSSVLIILSIYVFWTFWAITWVVLSSAIIISTISIYLISFSNYLYFDISFLLYWMIFWAIYMSYSEFFENRKEKAKLKEFTSKYVWRKLTEELLQKWKDDSKWFESKEMTIMFADIRWFSSISESEDPKKIANILNELFSKWNEIIFKNRWTLDKYIWDAIMAFWWAPIDNPNHEIDACYWALELIESIKVFNKKHGLQKEIELKIWIASWIATVWTIWSVDFADYTVIWDRVNLASRLESATRIYNLNILISEETNKKITWLFDTREIDLVRVKWRESPERIFELIWKKSEKSFDYINNHENALFFYRNMDFKKAKKMFEKNTRDWDPVWDIFLKRIELFKNIKKKDFDPIWKMESK